jgi:hypothetical protein
LKQKLLESTRERIAKQQKYCGAFALPIVRKIKKKKKTPGDQMTK